MVFSGLSENKYTLNNNHNQLFSTHVAVATGGGSVSGGYFSSVLTCSSVKDYCTLVFQWQWHGVPKFAQQISHFSHITVKTTPERLFDKSVGTFEKKMSISQSAYLSIFSMSVPTSHCSCRNSMGEEDCSSRIGTSELSSILKSTFGSESIPWHSNRNSSK